MTARERRVALIGGLTIVVALLLLKIFPWAVHNWRFASERLEQNRVLLAETRHALAELPRMEDSMRALTAAVSLIAPRLLSGSSADAALSDLSARMTAMAGWHHAALMNFTRQADSVNAGSLHRIGAVVVLQSDFRGLTGMIRSLARDSVATVVDRIKIVSMEPFGTEAAPEKLQIELQLSAWYLARSAGT